MIRELGGVTPLLSFVDVSPDSMNLLADLAQMAVKLAVREKVASVGADWLLFVDGKRRQMTFISNEEKLMIIDMAGAGTFRLNGPVTVVKF